MAGEMPALDVGRGFFGDLHHEGQSLFGEIAEQALVDAAPQVVRVADKGVAYALLQQLIQHAGGEERGIDVAVAGRVPLQLAVGRPVGRRELSPAGFWGTCAAGKKAAAGTASAVETSDSVAAWVLKLFISASRQRLSSAWRRMISRKDSPCLTLSRDFGPTSPMEVPSPPFSTMRTVRLQRAPAGLRIIRPARTAWGFHPAAIGRMSASWIRPVSPPTSRR